MGRSPRHFSSPSLAAARREGMEKLFTATWAFPEDFKWDVKEVWAILYLTGRALTAHFHCWTHHRWNMMKYYTHFGKSVITLARTEQIIISFHIWRSNICQARQTKHWQFNFRWTALHNSWEPKLLWKQIYFLNVNVKIHAWKWANPNWYDDTVDPTCNILHKLYT